jgi:hypothetical protein
MNTKKKIEQHLRAAPKPLAPDVLLDKLQADVSAQDIKTQRSSLRRWFAPTSWSISPWRLAAAAAIAIAVLLPLSYGAAKVIRHFKVGETIIVVKNSDKINNEKEAQKALEEFGKLYREGKAKEIKPGVWVVTLSSGEEFAFAGPHPELVGLPDADRNGRPSDTTFQDEHED